MVRISSFLVPGGLALVLLIGLGSVVPLEALTEEGESEKPQATSTPKKKEEAEPAAEEPESEFDQVMTPFGPMRVPRSSGRPAPRRMPSSQTSPSSSDSEAPPPDSPKTTPVEGGQAPAAPAGTRAAPTEAASPSDPSAGQATSRTPRAGERVRFSCVDCDLLEFVRNVASELKLNYVLDPEVKGVVNIHTYGEMRRGDLMSVLEAVLGINGAAMVKTGAVYQILPSQNAKQLPLDIRRGPQSTDSSAGESRVLQIVPMNFVSAAEMAELLTPYLSDGGDITAHKESNFLIITDTPSNIGKLLELIQVFDAEVFGDKRVRMYPLKNSRAASLVVDLERIFAGYALAEQSPIKFIPVARLNSVLTISSSPASFAEVGRWIAKLDHAGQSQEIRNYFFKVENGDAKNIAELLLKIYGKQSRGRAMATFPPQGGSGPEILESGVGETPDPPAQFTQGEIKIVADVRNNGLIIQCSPQDYEVIKETIQELDRVPRQVLINVKIYEVILSDELSMGVSAFLQDRNQPLVTSPSVTTASFSGSSDSDLPSGLNIATKVLVGNTRELVAFLNAEETRSRSRVLSAPTVIASDNVQASIQVGAQIPLLTSQGVVPGGTGGGSLFSNTIQNRSTGVILSVTPRINAGGWVTLEVQQEVSSPGPPPTEGIQSPSINIRSVNTQVTVRDGQTIAIGGIISDTKGLSKSRVPILGNIPGIGLLFGNTSKTSARTELIALITPHVIEDIEKATHLTEELKSTLKGLKKELKKTED